LSYAPFSSKNSIRLFFTQIQSLYTFSLLLLPLLSVNQGMQFEWDQLKAATNLKKHGVSFEEAKTVFDNPLAVIFDDEAHSIDESREIIIGHSQRNRLLLVVFTERSSSIRIISTRLATRKEREDYEQNSL
jgi:uncharacterized DUF497 family protein